MEKKNYEKPCMETVEIASGYDMLWRSPEGTAKSGAKEFDDANASNADFDEEEED